MLPSRFLRRGYTPIQMLIAAVVLCGCIAIALAVAAQLGIAIPPFVITIAWICFAVVVGVVAIKFLASFLSSP